MWSDIPPWGQGQAGERRPGMVNGRPGRRRPDLTAQMMLAHTSPHGDQTYCRCICCADGRLGSGDGNAPTGANHAKEGGATTRAPYSGSFSWQSGLVPMARSAAGHGHCREGTATQTERNRRQYQRWVTGPTPPKSAPSGGTHASVREGCGGRGGYRVTGGPSPPQRVAAKSPLQPAELRNSYEERSTTSRQRHGIDLSAAASFTRHRPEERRVGTIRVTWSPSAADRGSIEAATVFRRRRRSAGDGGNAAPVPAVEPHRPYLAHLLGSRRSCGDGGDERAAIAALLHDAVEIR